MKSSKRLPFKIDVRAYTPLLVVVSVGLIFTGGIRSSLDAGAEVAQPIDDSKTNTSLLKQTAEAKAAAEKAAAEKAAHQTKVQAAAIAPTYVPIATASPRGSNLYVDPSLTLAGRPQQITSQPTATWLGEWSGDVQSAANTLVGNATSQNALATIVAYNIPVRDCGSYSAGGANSSEYYKTWIRQLAAGIGQRKAIVILEPDALSQITCMNASDQAARYANLSDAVNVLSSQTNAFIYLDAGHSNWISAGDMADRLKKANVAQTRGFALNVSNFQTNASSVSYGTQLAGLIGKSFVIDTSRNGNGSNGEWCNPRGRALGTRPTTNVGGSVDAYLWIKTPGESDGNCNGGPSAGVWWEEYAQELIASSR